MFTGKTFPRNIVFNHKQQQLISVFQWQEVPVNHLFSACKTRDTEHTVQREEYSVSIVAEPPPFWADSASNLRILDVAARSCSGSSYSYKINNIFPINHKY